MPAFSEIIKGLNDSAKDFKETAYLQAVTKLLGEVLKKDEWISTPYTSYRLPENNTNPGPKTNSLMPDGNPWDKEMSFKTILDEVVEYEKKEDKQNKKGKLNFLKIALHQSKLRSTEQFNAVFKVIEPIMGKFSADSMALSIAIMGAQQKTGTPELEALNAQLLQEVKESLETMRLQFLEEVQKIEKGFLAGHEAIKYDYHPDTLEIDLTAFLKTEYACAKLTQGFLIALKEKLARISGEDRYQDLFGPYRAKSGEDQRHVDILQAFTLAIQKFIEKGAQMQEWRMKKVLAHAKTQKIQDFSSIETQIAQEMTRLGFPIMQVAPKTVMMGGGEKKIITGISKQPVALPNKPVPK